MSEEKIARLEKRCAREKKARLAAEEVLEEKSRELHDKNERLRRFSDDLEMQVAERTIELKEARDEALAAAATKSEFLANMSHELRTPMNGVLGMLKILEGTQLNDDQQDLLRIARSSGELLLSVINDVLDFSKIDADKMELENLPFRPELLLEEVVEPMVFSASSKSISLLYSADKNLPAALSGDPTRLKQIITNLVSNAIKFTDDGIVNVTMELCEDDWLIRVTDTGTGMSQRQLDHIFEAFNQGDSSITRTHGGTGLGLTIINRLAAMMGGDINVTSTVGKGSEFIVRLPVIEADAALVVNDKYCRSENIRFKNQPILLVEDNKVNQQIAISLLTELGLNITVAENGLEALQKLQFDKFELVLMDLQMPVMGGVEATRKIRALVTDYADIPIIAMTAHAGKEHIDECLSVGMNAHATKPIDLDELVHILTQWLESDSADEVLQPQNDEQSPDEIDGINLEEALPRVRNNWPLLKRLFATFLQDQEDIVGSVRDAILQDDMESCSVRLHTLKGSAANIGANDLAAIAAVMEKAAKAGDKNSLQENMGALGEQFSRVGFSLALLPSSNANSSNSHPLLADNTPTSQAEFVEQLTALSQILASDISEAENLLMDIQNRYGAQYGDVLKPIQQDLDSFDIDAAMERIKQQLA